MQFLCLDFSVEEIVKYQRRYEEGYDIPDPRYDCWVTMYHPESEAASKENSHPTLQSSACSNSSAGTLPNTSTSSGVRPPQSLFSKFLKTSTPKYKMPAKEPKTSARILTSAECLRIMQEKKRKKDEEAARKEKRKLAREEARLMKAINEKQKQLLKHTAKGGQGSGKMGKGVLVFKLTSMPVR